VQILHSAIFCRWLQRVDASQVAEFMETGGLRITPTPLSLPEKVLEYSAEIRYNANVPNIEQCCPPVEGRRSHGGGACIEG
jgi:hypothetical protein